MIQFSSLPPTPENTSFSEAGLFMFNDAEVRDYDAHQLAKDAGVFLASHTDYESAQEILNVLAQDERLERKGQFIIAAFNGITLQNDIRHRAKQGEYQHE